MGLLQTCLQYLLSRGLDSDTNSKVFHPLFKEFKTTVNVKLLMVLMSEEVIVFSYHFTSSERQRYRAMTQA